MRMKRVSSRSDTYSCFTSSTSELASGGIAHAAVELTLGPAGYVRELLAGALRDPSVEVAFAIDDGGRPAWVDELGRRIEPLRATGSRAVVPILSTGAPWRSWLASQW